MRAAGLGAMRAFAGTRASPVWAVPGGLVVSDRGQGVVKFLKGDEARAGYIHNMHVVAGAISPVDPDACVVVMNDGAVRALSVKPLSHGVNQGLNFAWSSRVHTGERAVDVAWLSPSQVLILTESGVVHEAHVGIGRGTGVPFVDRPAPTRRFHPRWLQPNTGFPFERPAAWTLTAGAAAVIDCHGAVWWRNAATRGEWHRLHTTQDAAFGRGRKTDPGPSWGVVRDVTFVDASRLVCLQTDRSNQGDLPMEVVMYNANDVETHTKWAATLCSGNVAALVAPEGTHGAVVAAISRSGVVKKLQY
jgi:hypothetical protein